jgi:hypothetical protein
MAINEQQSSSSAVLENEDLLSQIILKLGSSIHQIRCSRVSPLWRAVARGSAFETAFVGFLVEMQEGSGRIVKLSYAKLGEETTLIIRARVQEAGVSADTVVGVTNGFILNQRQGDGYFFSFPADVPRVYTRASEVIPRMPRNPEVFTVNTFGQFGVLPNAGRSGMSFFVKDASGSFVTCYDGVSFCSSTKIFIHCCVYDDALGWVRHISDPYLTREAALFHRNPYSVLDGTKLYMMYLVRSVHCYDMVSEKFTEIPLPTQVKDNARSWYDYTVASRREGGIVLVQYSKAVLYTWVLRYVDGAPNWTLQNVVDLIESFRGRITAGIWQRVISIQEFPLGSDHFFSVQVRSATDARFVMLTFGFDLGMFKVDMISGTVREITNVVRTGILGRIYALSESWRVVP